MSRKKYITIEVDKIKVLPEHIFESKIARCGNGAHAQALKRFIGKKCYIVIIEKEK